MAYVDLPWYKYLHDCKPDADYGKDFSRDELGVIIIEIENMRKIINSLQISLYSMDGELRENWEIASLDQGFIKKTSHDLHQ